MKVKGYIRRIDFEPKQDFLGFRTYAHIFIRELGGVETDVYTDDPRFEAPLLSVFDPVTPTPPNVEVHYEDVNGAKKVIRVIADREFIEEAGKH